MLSKDFLKFKNIILEEKLSNKFKNGHDYYWTIFLQNDVFKLHGVFSELGIGVFFAKLLGSFQKFLIS
jgi:hypothetical protein